MSRKNKKEFDEIKAGFDKEISKDIEKSKTPWHFINLHTYLHQMTANRIKDLYEQLAKIKMFLLIDIFAYVPILMIFTYFLIMWHVKV